MYLVISATSFKFPNPEFHYQIFCNLQRDTLAPGKSNTLPCQFYKLCWFIPLINSKEYYFMNWKGNKGCLKQLLSVNSLWRKCFVVISWNVICCWKELHEKYGKCVQVELLLWARIFVSTHSRQNLALIIKP